MVSSRLYKWKVEREIGQKEKKGVGEGSAHASIMFKAIINIQ